MANSPTRGTPTQEWEEEYAVNVNRMTAYVEDPEQDSIPSLLAYNRWRLGHQITFHRQQGEPRHWSREQKAKWSIVLQLTPKAPTSSRTADCLTTHTVHNHHPLLTLRETAHTHPPPPQKTTSGCPPQPARNTCHTASPNATSYTTTTPPTTHCDAAHYPCSGRRERAPSRGGKSSLAPRDSRTCGSGMQRRMHAPLAHSCSSA